MLPRIVTLLIYLICYNAYSSPFNVKLSSFNSGGGSVNTVNLRAFQSIGECVGSSVSESTRYILRGGFSNTVIPSTGFVGETDVYSQWLSGFEDKPIEIILKSDLSVSNLRIKDSPKHGIISGNPPNIIYTPVPNYFGKDFFTYYGINENGEKTDSAIVNISIKNINDPPVLNSLEIIPGEFEDSDTVFTYGQLLNFLNIIDYDNDEIKIIITDVANGTLFINGKEKSNQHSCKKGDNFIWRPEKDANGIINAFNLILFDGLEYSDVENINVSVEAVDDEIVINKLIDKIQISEGSEDKVIDLTSLYFDPDNEITYFIKDWSNKLLLTPKIDGNLLTLILNENNNGKSIVEIGGESNGNFIYSQFEIEVISVYDTSPFLVDTYWKGIYEGETEINLKKPISFWSFRNLENIEKSKIQNWKFDGDTNNPQLTDSEMLKFNNSRPKNIYFKNDYSIRMQSNTSLDLIIPRRKSGADWAKRNNSYTFIFDIKVRYGKNNPILNTDFGIDPFGSNEFWINPFGALGGQGDYSKYSSLQDNKWYRVAYVIDGKLNTIRYYVDEKLKLIRKVDNIIDGRHSIDSSVKIGYDPQLSNKNYQIKRIVYYDYPLNDSQINFLGRMSLAEFDEENSRNNLLDKTVLYFARENKIEGLNSMIFLSTFEPNKFWQIQSSSDLIVWKNSDIIETTIIEDSDNNLRTGYMILNDNGTHKFYRSISIID